MDRGYRHAERVIQPGEAIRERHNFAEEFYSRDFVACQTFGWDFAVNLKSGSICNQQHARLKAGATLTKTDFLRMLRRDGTEWNYFIRATSTSSARITTGIIRNMV
jgi:hypothetical protein